MPLPELWPCSINVPHVPGHPPAQAHTAAGPNALPSSPGPLISSRTHVPPQHRVRDKGAPGQAVTASLLLTFPETDNVALAGLVARIPGFDPGY